jgi:putative redox protein
MTLPPTKPPSRIHIAWAGGHQFDAGRPGGPTLRVDGDGVTAQSPVDALLTALATCSAADVVDILAKRRTPVERLDVDVVGERVNTVPRRFRHVLMEFRVDGVGIERVHAERAVELAVTKYCSVRASLAPDLAIEWTLTLNGERGAVIGEAAADYSV